MLDILDEFDHSVPTRLRPPADRPALSAARDLGAPTPPPADVAPAPRDLPRDLPRELSREPMREPPRILGEQPGHEERWLGL